MMLLLAFKLIAAYGLLFLARFIAVGAASDDMADLPPPVALPNCTAACGNLTVPYPFGIGSGCFLDELFEIECHRGGSITPVATLKNLMNVTVLNISLPVPDYSRGPDGFIEVSQPVFYSKQNLPNCTGRAVNGNIPTLLNLTGSSFMYSQTKNVFVSGGCNNLAFMVSPSMKSAVVGCRSTCAGNGTGGGQDACVNGHGCCMNTIPFGLQAYSVDFKAEDGSHKCRYAFLADQSQYEFPSNMTDTRALPSHVPVALEWGISNETFAKMRISDGAYQYLIFRPTYGCSHDDSPFLYGSDNPKPYMQCRCQSGYAGNPYITDGCKDINECLIPNATHCPGKCVNRPGSYVCVGNNNTVAMIGAGSGFGAVLLLGLLWWFYKFLKRRHDIKLKQKFFKRNGGLLLRQQLSYDEGNHMAKSKLFTSKELEKATDQFNENRILGKGGQGTVYKGMLTDGRIVAVKRSRIVDEGQVEQFINEVMVLSQTIHRNIVELLGCCLETEVPLLVYEFIPSGTLYQHLHNPTEEFPLSWEMRLRIATEVAGALSYLHFTAAIPIYHRDVKSSNILLDDKYRAKVADFGTSTSVAIDQTHLTTMVKGTIGYLDPEYFQTSQFTDKSDVYSFGVVIVELLTGQKPISAKRAEDGRSLAVYFIESMEENRLLDIVDAGVVKQSREEEILGVANLAKRCLNSNGRNRPTMKEVAMELERIRVQHVGPYTIEQNHHPIDHVRTRSVRAWHGFSMPTWSEAQISSLEVHLHMHNLE
ncbi:wall-associated receptor kinase-like 8 [Rhodamnia argentea]|uniref:Wall-associated receptor kinase-like 8 n=1 Tax=Rhodamnia argentea TaxID=178133 RepID=A0ABM3GTX6_9MYRT|nr:wall-associated receptor kinase-like 8 [Rhodamnia argentea]